MMEGGRVDNFADAHGSGGRLRRPEITDQATALIMLRAITLVSRAPNKNQIILTP